MSRIIISSPQGKETAVALPVTGMLRFGSATACDFVVSGDGVQPVHCLLKCSHGKVGVVAPDVAGEILVNGEPVRKRVLKTDDIIEFADHRIELRLDEKDPLLGKTLAGYKIEDVLGRGGTGTVYRACQLSLDRPVALKLLAPHLTRDANLVQSFLKEARAIARLSHPKVVHIHDAGMESGQFFFSMEYMPGGTLAQHLRSDGPLELTRALAIALDAAEALAWAEEHGIVHRDVKPGNLLLKPDGSVKLSDLGIALELGSASRTKAKRRAGSPRYMAPEQAAGGRIDHRVDIYALGCTLFQMITGHTPFEGKTAEVVRAKTTGPAPALRQVAPEVPAEVAQIVDRSLARSPKDRFRTCAELRDALAQALRTLQGEGATVTPVAPDTSSPPHPTSRPRRRQEIAAIAISVVIIVGATIWALVGGGSSGGADPTEAPGAGQNETAAGPGSGTSGPGGRQSRGPIDVGMEGGRTDGSRERSPGGDDGAGAGSGETEPSTLAAQPEADLATLKKLGDIARDARAGLMSDEVALRRLARFRRDHSEPVYASKIDLVEREIEERLHAAQSEKLRRELDGVVRPLLEQSEYVKAKALLVGLRSRYPSQATAINAEIEALDRAVASLWEAGQAQLDEALREADFVHGLDILQQLAGVIPEPTLTEVEARRTAVAAEAEGFEEVAAPFHAAELEIEEAARKLEISAARRLAARINPPSSPPISARILAAGKERLVADLARCARAAEFLRAGLRARQATGDELELSFADQRRDEVRARVRTVRGDGFDYRPSGQRQDERVAMLELTSGILLDLATAGAAALANGDAPPEARVVAEDLGILLFRARGPARAREILASAEHVGDEKAAAYATRLERAAASFLARRVGALVARLAELRTRGRSGGTGEDGSSGASELDAEWATPWQALATSAGELIRASGSEGVTGKHGDRLTKVFVEARAEAMRPGTPASLFHGKATTLKDGSVKIEYRFDDEAELGDFVPVSIPKRRTGISIERQEVLIHGEFRLFHGNPFRGRLRVAGRVPSRGYSRSSPNINVALWTHEGDVVTTTDSASERRVASAGANRASESVVDPSATPADFAVFGIGYYHPDASFLRVRGLNTVVPMPAMAFLGGTRGHRLYIHSPSECVWGNGVVSKVKGLQFFQIAFDKDGIQWLVNRRAQPIQKSTSYRRFDREEPYTGSVTIFTNGQTVRFSSLTVDGELDPGWVDSELIRRARDELKRLGT